MVVDIHCTLGPTATSSMDVDTLLSIMDANGVDRAIVGLGEAWLAARERPGNNWLISTVGRYSGRLGGYVTANPWRGSRAIGELERGLDQGLCAIKLHPGRQGFTLLEDVAEPVWNLAARMNVPVYVVTGILNASMPLQLAEVARRHPTVPLIMGRSGRTDLSEEIVPAVGQATNLYLETVYNSPGALASFLTVVGSERLLLATDLPNTVGIMEIEKLDHVPGLSSGKADVLGLNAARVFRLPLRHD